MSMRRILMCAPEYFRVAYEINPWMATRTEVDVGRAMRQWSELKSTLERAGATVEELKPGPEAKDWPDLVFTANAALVRSDKVYLATFYHDERKGETDINEKWFKNNGYQVSRDDGVIFEGAGDALFAGDDKLFAAFGQRSDPRVFDGLKTKLDDGRPFDIIACRLVDERFYHIDTAFCPLDSEIALWNPKAFDSESADKMKKHLELLPVDEKEACQFACNSVAVGKDVILPDRNEQTAKMLERNGFRPHLVDVSEFIKAGGACKCLTLRV